MAKFRDRRRSRMPERVVFNQFMVCVMGRKVFCVLIGKLGENNYVNRTVL